MRSAASGSILALFLVAGVAVAQDVRAYCIYNDLRDRSVALVQEDHPEKSRQDRKLDVTLAPGKNQCCNFWNLDCNPGGREEAVVGIAVKIVEEPDVICGLPGGKYHENQVSVTGTGTLHIVTNPRKNSDIPYVIRARARDGKDLSGPSGIACRKPRKD
jgi:hypothetical protein